MMVAKGSQVSGWTRLFLDDDGNPSSMRVMSAIAFLASAYLAVVEVYAEVTEQAGNTEFVFYFLAARSCQRHSRNSQRGRREHL